MRAAAALLFACALAVLAALERGPLLAQYHLVRLRHFASRVDPAAELDAIHIALGPAGRRALETIAFTPDAAPESMRQSALQALWAVDYAEKRFSEDRLLRYLREARGLERDQQITILFWPDGAPRRSPEVQAAALEAALLCDGVSPLRATRYLRDVGDRAAVLRIALESPDSQGRRDAVASISPAVHPEERPVLHRLLADGDKDVRFHAALGLASVRDGAGRPILLAGMAEGRSRGAIVVSLLALGNLGDRATVRAIVRLGERASDLGLYANCALEQITGHILDPGETWPAWWAAHEGEFPPQVDAP